MRKYPVETVKVDGRNDERFINIRSIGLFRKNRALIKENNVQDFMLACHNYFVSIGRSLAGCTMIMPGPAEHSPAKVSYVIGIINFLLEDHQMDIHEYKEYYIKVDKYNTPEWHGTVNGQYWNSLEDEAAYLIEALLKGGPSGSWFKYLKLDFDLLTIQDISNLEWDALKTGVFVERYRYDCRINYAAYDTYIDLKEEAAKGKAPEKIHGNYGAAGTPHVRYKWHTDPGMKPDGLAEYLEEVYGDVTDHLKNLFASSFPDVSHFHAPCVVLDSGSKVPTNSRQADYYVYIQLKQIARQIRYGSYCPQEFLTAILENSHSTWQGTMAKLCRLKNEPSVQLSESFRLVFSQILDVFEKARTKIRYGGSYSGLYTGNAIIIYYRQQGNYEGEEHYKSVIANTLAHEMFHAFHHFIAPETFGKGILTADDLEDSDDENYSDGCDLFERWDEDARYDEAEYPRDGDFRRNNDNRSLGDHCGVSVEEQWENTVVEEATAEYYALLYSVHNNPGRMHLYALDQYRVINRAHGWKNDYDFSPYSYALHFLEGVGDITDYALHNANRNIRKLIEVIKTSRYSMQEAYELLVQNDVSSMVIPNRTEDIDLKIVIVAFPGHAAPAGGGYSYLYEYNDVHLGDDIVIISHGRRETVHVTCVRTQKLRASGHPIDFYKRLPKI